MAPCPGAPSGYPNLVNPNDLDNGGDSVSDICAGCGGEATGDPKCEGCGLGVCCYCQVTFQELVWCRACGLRCAREFFAERMRGALTALREVRYEFCLGDGAEVIKRVCADLQDDFYIAFCMRCDEAMIGRRYPPEKRLVCKDCIEKERQ